MSEGLPQFPLPQQLLGRQGAGQIGTHPSTAERPHRSGKATAPNSLACLLARPGGARVGVTWASM